MPVVGVLVVAVEDPAVAEMVECRVFPFGDLTTVHRQLRDPGGDVFDGRSETAASSNLRQLMIVADQDHFRPHSPCGGQDTVQVKGPGHPRLINNHHMPVGQVLFGVEGETREGVGVDPGAVTEFAGCPG